MRNAGRHLSHKRQPLALRQFPLQLQLFLEQPAQIQRPRQLLAKKLQRRAGLSGKPSPVRLRVQHAGQFSSLPERKVIL